MTEAKGAPMDAYLLWIRMRRILCRHSDRLRVEENMRVADADAKLAAARFVRGSIAIQDSSFTTTADHEQERNDLKRYPLP